MNSQGMRGIHPIFVGNFMDYDTYVRKLSDVCPRFDVVWVGESDVCKKCLGTGIESYFNHGHGEESVEPIKCEMCDGFGREIS